MFAEPEREPPRTPCCICKEPAAFQVWGPRDVCAAHFADWQQSAPNAGEVEAKYGEGFDALCAAYQRFTANWAKQRQATSEAP